MKRILCILCAVVLMCGMTAIYVNADIEENQTISVPKATPTIDGTINTDEGWSSAAYLNEKTSTCSWSTNPLTTTVDFYFAYADDGIYFAANTNEVGSAYRVRIYDSDGQTKEERSYIDADAGSYTFTEGGFPSSTPDGLAINYYKIDESTTSAPAGVTPDVCFWSVFTGNSYITCTGEDNIDSMAGYNGDVVGLNFDLLGEFDAEQFVDNTDKLPTYYFGLFDDGTVKVYRTEFNDADITSECKTAGKQNGVGFTFEAYIPWNVIVDDANTASAEMGLEHTYTIDEVKAVGATHRASVVLFDRFYDTETGENDTWGRYITVCNKTSTGVSGASTSGDNLLSYGLHLQMGQTAASVSTTAANKTTTTATVQTGYDTSENAAQTFDIGMAGAIGAIICSGIGLGFVKKKK